MFVVSFFTSCTKKLVELPIPSNYNDSNQSPEISPEVWHHCFYLHVLLINNQRNSNNIFRYTDPIKMEGYFAWTDGSLLLLSSLSKAIGCINLYYFTQTQKW